MVAVVLAARAGAVRAADALLTTARATTTARDMAERVRVK
jgi:hypothetical protein